MAHVRRMNQRFFIGVGTVVAVMVLTSAALLAPSSVLAAGATHIAGVGVYADSSDCGALVVDADGDSPNYALLLAGDLEGCLYTFVDAYTCSPSGTYHERGTELFVGEYHGAAGTFRTTYRFEAKYEECDPLGAEIFGRCQHPIVEDSGTGVFAGVRGRLDFKDDIEAGNFPYRGHLRWAAAGMRSQALSLRTAC